MENFTSTHENLLRRSTNFAQLTLIEQEFSERNLRPINWAKIYLLSKVSNYLTDIANSLMLARNQEKAKPFFVRAGSIIDNLFLIHYEEIVKLVTNEDSYNFIKALNNIDTTKDIHLIRTIVVNNHIKRGLRKYDPQVDF